MLALCTAFTGTEIDTGLVTIAKIAFEVRLAQWQSHLSQGPSMEDLYNRIRNEEWEPDSIVEAIVERAQDSDESDADFMLLKCVSALCGPNELASIHVEKGLARFKSQTASVCDKSLGPGIRVPHHS